MNDFYRAVLKSLSERTLTEKATLRICPLERVSVVRARLAMLEDISGEVESLWKQYHDGELYLD